MSGKFDYTAFAQRSYARFPILTYLGIQINFWIVANILLGVIVHLHFLSISQTLKIPEQGRLAPLILVAVILGILYGITLGVTDHFLDKNIFRKRPLGKIILFKTVIYLTALILILRLIRFVLFDFIIAPSVYVGNLTLSDKSWEYLFYMLVIYYFFMTLVISFINQVNKKYGPGILVPLLLGKYRNPKEEERIFLFMDLKSSTSLAEELGHLKYSSFIRDSFMDINQVLPAFNAEVYQYVGDQIVVMWRVRDGLRGISCIRFFFACEKQFLERSSYYLEQYGILPHFKAGIHMGKVTVVEIGEIKRDIAYHGDTLNTAARIQSVCNEYNKTFLISAYLLDKIGQDHGLSTEALGMIQLKGKTTKVGISSVDRIENDLSS